MIRGLKRAAAILIAAIMLGGCTAYNCDYDDTDIVIDGVSYNNADERGAMNGWRSKSCLFESEMKIGSINDGFEVYKFKTDKYPMQVRVHVPYSILSGMYPTVYVYTRQDTVLEEFCTENIDSVIFTEVNNDRFNAKNICTDDEIIAELFSAVQSADGAAMKDAAVIGMAYLANDELWEKGIGFGAYLKTADGGYCVCAAKDGEMKSAGIGEDTVLKITGMSKAELFEHISEREKNIDRYSYDEYCYLNNG